MQVILYPLVTRGDFLYSTVDIICKVVSTLFSLLFTISLICYSVEPLNFIYQYIFNIDQLEAHKLSNLVKIMILLGISLVITYFVYSGELVDNILYYLLKLTGG